MPSNIDLHTHSNMSDGTLSPTELVQRAHSKQVKTLALTDHDTTNGLFEARKAAQTLGVNLINGVEVSVTWEKKTIHIIGLNIDPGYEPLKKGLIKLQETRSERAEQIGIRLKKIGIPDAYEASKSIAGEGMITRTHFAHYIVQIDRATSMQNAFDRYLGQGKPGFVHTNWVDMGEAIGWIVGAGGNAVIAHPLRYRLTGSWIRRLLSSFKDAGGQAIEVVCGNSNPNNIRDSANYANRFDLAGSVGSDFHSPERRWIELGKFADLPATVKPLWNYW